MTVLVLITQYIGGSEVIVNFRVFRNCGGFSGTSLCLCATVGKYGPGFAVSLDPGEPVGAGVPAALVARRYQLTGRLKRKSDTVIMKWHP